MVIANSITRERRSRLSDLGISFKEIAESQFIEQSKNTDQENSEKQEIITSTITDLNPATINNYNKKFDKENFQKAFDKCGKDIQELFISILKEIDCINAKKYPTNKPDYRLQKKNIFCEFVLLPNKGLIQINLRVDSKHIISNKINLEEIKDPSKPGKKWLKFYIDNNTPKNEIIRLIGEVYKFSE